MPLLPRDSPEGHLPREYPATYPKVKGNPLVYDSTGQVHGG